jgi:hypothetical protein
MNIIYFQLLHLIVYLFDNCIDCIFSYLSNTYINITYNITRNITAPYIHKDIDTIIDCYCYYEIIRIRNKIV